MTNIGNFILLDSYVKKRSENDVLFIVLDTPYVLEREKEAIEYRKNSVRVLFKSNDTQEQMEDMFKLHDVKFKDLKNGPRLQLILTHEYTKEKELQQVELRNHSLEVFVEKVNEDLFDDDNDIQINEVDNEEYEQQDYS